MKRFALFLALVVGSFAIYENKYIFMAKKTMVNAKVATLTYKPTKVYLVQSYNLHTKITSIKHLIHPARYWVTVEYDGYAETLDCKNLYSNIFLQDFLFFLVLMLKFF